MCDGVTQGQDSMELSLFSRDTIALSTAVALSHGMFDPRCCWASATRSCRAC
jgi:phosphogluconate dehydratase